MPATQSLITELHTIRNKYGKKYAFQKLELLDAIGDHPSTAARSVLLYRDTLLFLIAYPDNKVVFERASEQLEKLHAAIQANKNLEYRLYNSGITHTRLSAAYGFEMVKWIRQRRRDDIRLTTFDADDSQVSAIVSVVMPKVESEILQDANATWKEWLKRSMKKGEELLDAMIALFDQADLRPEVRDELWNAMGMNVEVSFSVHDCLPRSLYKPYYHRSLIRKNYKRELVKPDKVALSETEAAQIVDCSRMILVRHLREMDPITFTSPKLISYYRLERGFSIVLTGMVPDRRHPIDSYMGYVIFKNGLPFGYAGSWILFDSARIGLNIFPAYRGGESQYIFDQVLKLHAHIYRLARFSVDPYQIGKHNSDGIHSGVFWLYHHLGFRPMKEQQKQIAEAEAKKMRSQKKYRSPVPVLKELSDSRLELFLNNKAFRYDATDISIAYAGLVNEKFNGDRKKAEQSYIRLAEILHIKNHQDANMQFVLKNWCVLLLYIESELLNNTGLKKTVKKLVELKAHGAEEEYIREMQQAKDLRKILEGILIEV